MAGSGAVVWAEGASTKLLVLLSAAGMVIAALLFHAAPHDKGTGRCLLHLVAAIIGGVGVCDRLPGHSRCA